MRFYIAFLVVVLSQDLPDGRQFAITGEPTPSGLGKPSDLGNLKRIKDAVVAGNSKSAISELRTLPTRQRLEWLSELHQSASEQDPNGGSSMADYTALIDLIENVIDAEWAVNGGSASAIPYRQGVRIDSNGLIERLDSNKAMLATLKLPRDQDQANVPVNIPLDELGEWQQASSLRWISLHQLDAQVAERLHDTSKKSRANIAMELLGGLYRIDFLAFDKESREWYLGGPAGNLVANKSGEILNPETGLPPVLLEDLLSVAPHVLGSKGEFGCSIDPDPERLTAAYEMARSSSAMRSMQRQPDRWTEQWRQKLGKQHAKVIGLSQDSPTGYALLIADAHMKRLGLGLEHCPPPMKSYWQEKAIFDNSSNGADASMVRWWFSVSDQKIPMDPDRKFYHFASSNVQVLSEAQMMNAKGERVATNSPDFAADTFAKKFTRNFDRLQRDYPVYGRLRHIFDLAIALEIIRNEIRGGTGKPFLAINNPEGQPRLPVTPLELDSVAATHRMPKGVMSSIISGGVTIQTSDLSHRLAVDKSQTNKVALESSNHTSKIARTESESVHLIENPDKILRPRRDIPFWK